MNFTMNFTMKLSQAFVVGFLLFSGCTKVERVVETRQASPNIRESFLQSHQKTLSLKTSALGKVFMLVANSKTSGQQPSWIEHPVKLVTFEKSGAQLGLFEVGYLQIYSSLSAQKLLQTFEIVSETPDQVVINIEKGFTGLNSESSFEVMRSDKNEEALKVQGSEVTAVVKDLLVQSAEVQDDKVHITQFSRVQRPAWIVQTQRKNKVDKEIPVLIDVESSFDTRIDIFPYIENKNFKPKEQDPDWTIGMFISRILKEASRDTLALANRWDVRQPVRYVIVGQPPKEAVPYIKDGLEYWNRVAGREIVHVEVSEQIDLEPSNGTVVVRWIPWKDAGSAYAGIQQNPLTGEILRGQIYLPSSWLDPDLIGDSLTSTSLAKNGINCEVTTSAAKDIAVLNQTVSKATKLAVFDYLRYVVAHESGHTLGMRHHFSASSLVKASFEEINQATETYRKDPSQAVQYPEMSLSIMNYMVALDSAIVGHSLRTRALSYDKDLIEWAYNGKDKLSSVAGDFCTDDHLRYAGEEGVSILGCGRFQNVGNPLMAQLKAINQRDDESIKSEVKTIRDDSISADGKFKVVDVSQYYQGTSVYTLSKRTKGLDNLLFSIKNEKDNKEENLLLLTGEVTKILLEKQTARDQSSAEVRNKLTEQFKEITDIPSRQRLILPVDEQGKIDTDWAKNQLAKIDLKEYQKGKTASGVEYQLSDDEFAQLKSAIEETIRYDQRAKMLHSALHLMVNKKETLTIAMGEKDAAEKTVSVSYRDWVANSKIKEMLKAYLAQLVVLDLGPKKIAEVKGQPVYGKFYFLNRTIFTSLKTALQESSIQLGLPLNTLVSQRARDISELLATLGVTLDPETPPEEQIKVLDNLWIYGQLDSSVASWAKTEFELNQALLEQGTL